MLVGLLALDPADHSLLVALILLLLWLLLLALLLLLLPWFLVHPLPSNRPCTALVILLPSWCPFLSPLCSKPAVSVLTTSNTVGSTSYNVTVDPVVVSPGASFPTGGWSYYRINVTVDGDTTIVNCT